MKKRSVTKKVFIPLLMAASLTSAMLAGCGSQTSVSDAINSAESVLAAAQDQADKETAAAENENETLTAASPETAEILETTETKETPEGMTTLEFARQLSIGWNLGNTLDAYTMQAGGNQGLAS